MEIFKRKNKLLRRFIGFAFAFLIAFYSGAVAKTSAYAYGQKVYLGGFAAGFDVGLRGATVIGLSDVITETGVVSPAKSGGIEPDDVILSINGYETNTSKDIEKAFESFDGGTVVLAILRDGKTLFKDVAPVKDLTGKYKLGVFVRDDLTGIGTVTYVKDDGEFMALGHHVSYGDEIPLEIIGGGLYPCSIFGVEKGERGKAGELKGMFINDVAVGGITENLSVGIKGYVNGNFNRNNLKEISTGKAKVGEAEIVATLDGVTPERYSVSIVKVDKNEKKNRNYVLKVTDEKLIEIAGGIVQGMSGSPIVQNGKLVGAVTHVFLNDPTRGYGIDVEKMLAS